MKNLINRMSRYCWHRSFGLLLIRIAIGMVFLAHGWSKVGNMAATEGMFSQYFGLPAWVAVFIAYLEVIGGVAMILGILTRVFGVILGIEMIVAYFLTGGLGVGYKPHELELVLMLLSFGVALTGSGRWSLYKMECDDCGGMLCKGDEGCSPATHS